jgi:hypothetical protein
MDKLDNFGNLLPIKNKNKIIILISIIFLILINKKLLKKSKNILAKKDNLSNPPSNHKNNPNLKSAKLTTSQFLVTKPPISSVTSANNPTLIKTFPQILITIMRINSPMTIKISSLIWYPEILIGISAKKNSSSKACLSAIIKVQLMPPLNAAEPPKP